MVYVRVVLCCVVLCCVVLVCAYAWYGAVHGDETKNGWLYRHLRLRSVVVHVHACHARVTARPAPGVLATCVRAAGETKAAVLQWHCQCRQKT
jgi:hypothetical protein